LASAASLYLRPLLDHLDALKAAGKDRLVVVPHGASHFLPIHLLGPEGHPLADGWTVTYAPNACLLAPVRRPPSGAARRQGAAVLALGYADQPRLAALPSSAAEGQAIGAILGTEPVTDGEATEHALVEALESRRYVHVRAHGQHNVDAPLFQTVFLSPGDGGDGRFRAHEILPLDLRGLELVTLGACETALGRVDLSDNPRGLPAALLLAGAEAVVGTLWEVNAEASSAFFTALYGALVADDSDLIGAFGVAQRATRATYPEYRDWGAFYLVGGCRGAKEQP
jgi:CHAT domain-containing protein